MIAKNRAVQGYIVGDVIHLDPDALPELLIISEDEAAKKAERRSDIVRQFVITGVQKK